MVILPHGITVAGAGQKAPGAFDLNLSIDGDGRHAVVTSTAQSGIKARAVGAFLPLLFICSIESLSLPQAKALLLWRSRHEVNLEGKSLRVLNLKAPLWHLLSFIYMRPYYSPPCP
jgi:hypothetical protein